MHDFNIGILFKMEIVRGWVVAKQNVASLSGLSSGSSDRGSLAALRPNVSRPFANPATHHTNRHYQKNPQRSSNAQKTPEKQTAHRSNIRVPMGTRRTTTQNETTPHHKIPISKMYDKISDEYPFTNNCPQQPCRMKLQDM